MTENIELILSDTRVKANKLPWSDGVEFLIGATHHPGAKRALVTKLIWTVMDEPTISVEPTFILQNKYVQELMDELWICGFRPTEGTGSAGSLKATENHLKDMHDLVWKLLPGILKNES